MGGTKTADAAADDLGLHPGPSRNNNRSDRRWTASFT
jgi:hypothetical protein